MFDTYEIIKMKESGAKYIVIGVKSNENMGSCGYDREYFCVPYTKERDLTVNMSDVKRYATFEVRRTTTLPFTVMEKHEYKFVGSVETIDENGKKTKEVRLKRVKKTPSISM